MEMLNLQTNIAESKINMENMSKKRSLDGDSFLEYDPKKRSKLEDTILQLTGKDGAANSKPVMKKIENSSILDKVKSFLPELKKSTIDLKKQAAELGSEHIDIENVDDCEEVIQFDLSVVPNMEGGIPSLIHELLRKEGQSDDSDSDSDVEESEPEDDPKSQRNLIQEM